MELSVGAPLSKWWLSMGLPEPTVDLWVRVSLWIERGEDVLTRREFSAPWREDMQTSSEREAVWPRAAAQSVCPVHDLGLPVAACSVPIQLPSQTWPSGQLLPLLTVVKTQEGLSLTILHVFLNLSERLALLFAWVQGCRPSTGLESLSLP